MLFTSDEKLRELQRKTWKDVARTTKRPDISPEELRRELIEADRELREHQRWRQFAFVLFIVPILAAIVVAVINVVAGMYVGSHSP